MFRILIVIALNFDVHRIGTPRMNPLLLLAMCRYSHSETNVCKEADEHDQQLRTISNKYCIQDAFKVTAVPNFDYRMISSV